MKIFYILFLVLFQFFFPLTALGVVEGEGPAATKALGESVESAVGEVKGKRELPPVIPPPSFAKHKHVLPDLLLKDKKEGRYIIPVPVVGFDPDTGVNFGAGVSFFQNGKNTSPFFRITPYRQLILAQIIATSKKVYQLTGLYDQPYIFDTPWRVRGELELYTNPIYNYFGIGRSGTALTYPGSTQIFGSYRDYKNAMDDAVNGASYSHYDEYKYTKMAVRGAAEYDLIGGLLRPLVGFQIAHVWISDYTGSVSGNDVQQSTHLRDDCDSGRAIGCKGGNDIYLKLGITFDTRDFEPDPRKGIILTAMNELSPKFLGSAFNYGRLTTAVMGFGDILRYKTQQLVLTGRFTYSYQFGDIPFYSMGMLAMEDQDRPGLGGIETLRGYSLNRFIAPVALLANTELRYTFTEFNVFKQNIKLMAVPFLDFGRVFDSNKDISFRDWKLGGGAGIHLAWNLSTVVSFDYAFSSEDRAFYMDIGHQF